MFAIAETDFKTGKKHLRFLKRTESMTYESVKQIAESRGEELMLIPCGQCAECRAQYARNWANRLLLELQYHDSAYFITLTYDDDHIHTTWNRDGIKHLTLCKRDCQLFMKRLRKEFVDDKIRYFLAGEYGDTTHRPHYHAIIFGLHLDDLQLAGKNELGQPYYNSASLQSVWQNGFVTVAEVTWASCCYVARYCLKKLNGDLRYAYDEWNIEPPFVLMSRKPGIGFQWFVDHHDCFDFGHINVATPNGRKSFRPPRYFEKLLDDDELTALRSVHNQLYARLTQDNLTANTSLSHLEQLKVVAASHENKKERKF